MGLKSPTRGVGLLGNFVHAWDFFSVNFSHEVPTRSWDFYDIFIMRGTFYPRYYRYENILFFNQCVYAFLEAF